MSLETIREAESQDAETPLPPPAAPVPAGPAPFMNPADLAWALVLVPVIIFATVCVVIGMRWLSMHESLYITIRRTYYFSTLVFPAVLAGFVPLGLLGWWRLRHRAFGRATLAVAGAALAILAVRGYATHYEPYRLQVRRISIPTAKLRAPLRLVHLSDIQTPAIRAYERRVFDLVRDLKPDLVVHTGDLMQPVPPASFESERPKLEALIASLKPPLGFFNVIGDCDDFMHSMPADWFPGMRTLINQGVTIDAPQGRIRLFGLDHDQAATDAPPGKLVEDWMKAGAPGDLDILLGHSPDYILAVKELPIDLCLAGHTHGGQIRIPGFGPILTECHLPRDWAWGFRAVGKTRLNVSCAVGSEHIYNLPAIRVNCPPEVIVIDFIPQK